MALLLRAVALLALVMAAALVPVAVARAEEGDQSSSEPVAKNLHPDRQFEQAMEKQANALTARQFKAFGEAFTDGRFDDALSQINQVLAVEIKLLGVEHPKVKDHQNIAGLVARARSFSAENQARLVEATNLRQVGRLAFNAGRFALAEENYRSAAERVATAAGTDNYLYSAISLELARLYIYDKRFSEAAEICDKQVPRHLIDNGELSRTYAEALNLHGLVHIGINRAEEGSKFLTHSAQILEQLFGKDSLEYTHSRRAQAILNLAKGNLDAAESELAEILELSERRGGKGSQNDTTWTVDLAEVKLLKGDHQAALQLASEALARYEKNLPTDSVWTAQALELQARIHTAMGDAAAAKLAADRAGAIRLR